MAKELKAHALVDAQHGRSGATGPPPKLGEIVVSLNLTIEAI